MAGANVSGSANVSGNAQLLSALHPDIQSVASTALPGGVGTVGDAYTSVLSGAPNAAALTAQINSAAGGDATTAMGASAVEGIASAASGKGLSATQVASIGTSVAIAAAVAAGVTVSAATLGLAPLAAAVFVAGDVAFKKLVSLTKACHLSTSSTWPEGVPGTPGHKTYAQLVGYVSGNAPVSWQPYTQGTFETAMRPVLIRIYEIYWNGGALPAVSEVQALQGVIDFWNKHAPPGTPMRSIPFINDDISISHPEIKFGDPRLLAWSADPVQMLFTLLFESTTVDMKNCTTTYHGQPHPWSLQVAALTEAEAETIATTMGAPEPGAAPSPVLHAAFTLHPGVGAAPGQGWETWLPFVPAVLGLVAAPFVGVLGPLIGGSISALWYEIRKS